MKKEQIAILGAGNMATALAHHLANRGHEVRMYCIEPEVEYDINQRHRNKKFLPKIRLDPKISATPDIKACLKNAAVVIMAVPSHAVAEVITKAKPFLTGGAIVSSISKGFDPKTLDPIVMTQIKELPAQFRKRVCMLGGPAIAGEMAAGSPTAFVIAGEDKKARETLAKIFNDKTVKATTSEDLLGVGLTSALKNTYAIALGMCDGLRYSTNAKAFLVTLATKEMRDILKARGAHGRTASSLAGLGDLLVTGFSPYGRNRRYGEKLVGARYNDPARLGIRTVEGIPATDIGLKLTKKLGVKAPLLQTVYNCIHRSNSFETPFVKYLENLTLSMEL
ncbi:MAG: NAD(P)H-dependent glycerol-3-phosphate dehydrogenase [Patescibacteria group bacterium]|nr:NAD(P)H-dependent glycerol-3-phosphate dehydrogenase [Patescibacteria group bacterium]